MANALAKKTVPFFLPKPAREDFGDSGEHDRNEQGQE
jgi:hypothetical protein